MSAFFAFLAARHRAILFSIFLLLIFIARWQIIWWWWCAGRAFNWIQLGPYDRSITLWLDP